MSKITIVKPGYRERISVPRGFLIVVAPLDAGSVAVLTDGENNPDVAGPWTITGSVSQVGPFTSNANIDCSVISGEIALDVIASVAAGGGGVTSVFGRTGIVGPQANDYAWSQIGSKPTTKAGFGITDVADLSHSHGSADVTDFSTAADARVAAAVGVSVAAQSHIGTGGAAHSNVIAAGAAGFMTGTDKTKLDGIAAGATANSSDAVLLARANHTGTQAGSTVTGAYTASGMTMATARLLGRTTASTGAAEEISIGSGLTMSAGVLTSTGGGAAVLDDLTDVVITTPSTGQVLKYNGTTWINDTDATGGGGSVTITGTPADNQLAVWTGSSAIEGDAALSFNTTTDQLTIGAGSVTRVGAHALTLTTGATTDVTFPATGTLATLAGAESLSNKSFVAPALGTPASGTLTNCTGYTAANIASIATGVATFLTTAPTSATFATLIGGDLAVVDGGTGRSTSTTAYGLIAAGTTATGAHQTLAAGATTDILVGGGAAALPAWTTATGTGAPVRATDPTLTRPVLSGIWSRDGAEITTASAMGANSVDTTKVLNTKSIAADTTFTFSGAPATANAWFNVVVTNTDTAAHALTLPSCFNMTTGTTAAHVVTIQPSGKAHLTFRYDGSAYNFYGDTGYIDKFNATAAPAVGDDIADGYGPGSLWLNTTSNLAYVCESNAAGAAVWNVLGGGISDADYGDVTVAAGVWTIDAGVVTLAKMANIATDSLIGRDTTGTGVPEAITVGGGIEFTGAGALRTTAFTGDVTKTAGGTALTIANSAVTLAKMADLAASRFIGRVTASTGVPEAMTGTQATTLLDTFTTSLKGLVPASGGGTTNFLRADGTFAAPAGGGTVTNTGGNLTANALVLGAGTTDTKVAAGIVSDGTSKVTLGVAGASVGGLLLANATSGTVELRPVTGALGTAVVSVPAVTGTMYVTGGTDVAVADGGTGLSSGTSGGVLAFTATGTLASSGALTASGLVLGGGAGAVPSTVAGLASDGASQLQLGVAGTSVGSVQLRNATSGSITIQPTTGALGTVTLTAPATTGTIGLAAQTQGKHLIPITAAGMTPSATGGCAALATIASAANQPDIVTLDFDTATQEFAQFSIPMPEKWNEGTVTFQAIWSHAATTTNFGVAWQLQGLAVSDNEAITQAYGTAVVVTDTGGTTNNVYTTAESSAITIAGTPANKDTVFFRVARVPADAADTMAIDARLHGIRLYYTTNADTDA